jgi:hypothetical protein
LLRRPLLLGFPLFDRDRSRASAAADAAVSEFVRPFCQARTQGHRYISPLARSAVCPLVFRFLLHSLTLLASFSSFVLLLLRLRVFATLPPFPVSYRFRFGLFLH